LTSETKPVLIIDLDETLLRVNSFTLWAKYFIFGKFNNMGFFRHNLLRTKAAVILAKRKLLKHSHAATKAALHKLWISSDNKYACDIFLASLEKEIRPNMRELLNLIAGNKIDAILATAASSAYAEPFARKIGFANVIATGLYETENRSEEKAKRANEFLKKQNWQNRKKIFFTDHLEDMPFIKQCDMLMWFGKADEIEIIKQERSNLEIFLCSDSCASDILTKSGYN